MREKYLLNCLLILKNVINYIWKKNKKVISILIIIFKIKMLPQTFSKIRNGINLLILTDIFI